MIENLHSDTFHTCLGEQASANVRHCIDHGFPDILTNCLHLQCLLLGIKQHQGSNLPQRQLVTADLVSVLHQSLDFTNPDNVMLWAACCLGFFGFLRAGEFTMNGTFDPTLHLTMADVQLDSSTNPQSFRVFIMCFKTDPFRKGCFIFIQSWVVVPSLFVQCFPCQTTFKSVDQTPDLSLFTRMSLLSQGLSCLPFFKLPYNQQVSLESSQAIVFKLELQLLLPGKVFLNFSLRLWGTGLAKLICYMCILQWKPSFLSQDDLLSRYELFYPSLGLLF